MLKKNLNTVKFKTKQLLCSCSKLKKNFKTIYFHYRYFFGRYFQQFQLSTLWVACCVSILCIPIYSVMFWCRYRILRMLERPGYMFNTTTTLQIKRLVKVIRKKNLFFHQFFIFQALTVQSLIPVFTLFPASLIFLSTQFHVIETTKFGYIIISLLSLSKCFLFSDIISEIYHALRTVWDRQEAYDKQMFQSTIIENIGKLCGLYIEQFSHAKIIEKNR